MIRQSNNKRTVLGWLLFHLRFTFYGYILQEIKWLYILFNYIFKIICNNILPITLAYKDIQWNIKNRCFYLMFVCWFQIWNSLLLITSGFWVINECEYVKCIHVYTFKSTSCVLLKTLGLISFYFILSFRNFMTFFLVRS